jgi:Putative adhesin
LKTMRATPGIRRLPAAIVIVGAFAIAAVFSGCGQSLPHVGGQQVSETVTKEYDVGASQPVIINTASGDIDVTASDANSVTINAEKRAPSSGDLQQMNVSFTIAGDGIRAEYKSDSNTSNRSVTFHVTAPRAATLQLNSGGGSISTVGFTGSVSANSGNGSTTIKNQNGPVSLRAGNGSVSADGSIKGPSSAIAGNGSVTVTLPSDSQLQIRAMATNGSIASQFGPPIAASNGSQIDMKLGDGSDGSLLLQTGNGSIHINKQQ